MMTELKAIKSNFDFQQNGEFLVEPLDDFLNSKVSGNLKPYRSDKFLIYYIEDGAPVLHVDLQTELNCCNAVYCIYPGQFHQFTISHPVRGFVISFSMQFVQDSHRYQTISLLIARLFNLYALIAIPLCDKSKLEIHQVISRMKSTFNSTSPVRDETLISLLGILLICLVRKVAIPTYKLLCSNQDLNFVNQFFEMIQKEFMVKKKISEYADAFFMAPNYLNAKIKRITGKTASYHLQQRIIHEAKRKARWENMNLKQISYYLGYDDLSHFSIFFKKFAGMSFTKFKKSTFDPVAVRV